jgi:hypothetical protein
MVIYTPSYDKQSRSYDVLNIDQAAEISRLIRFEQSENFKILSLVQVQSQKTLNTKLLVNVLKFPFITHTLKSDKQRRSYDHCNLGDDAENPFLDRASYLNKFGL